MNSIKKWVWNNLILRYVIERCFLFLNEKSVRIYNTLVTFLLIIIFTHFLRLLIMNDINVLCAFNFVDCIFFFLVLGECQTILISLGLVLIIKCIHLVRVFIFIQLFITPQQRWLLFINYVRSLLLIYHRVFLIILLLEIIALNKKIFILSLLIQIQFLLTLVFYHLPAIIAHFLFLRAALLASILWGIQ